MYERQPSLIFGGTAAGQFRDTYGWREIVPWQPIDEASRALDDWLNSHGLSRAQATDKMRREVRGDNGGEMRVLASPGLLRH
jgi:hypothetical protein